MIETEITINASDECGPFGIDLYTFSLRTFRDGVCVYDCYVPEMLYFFNHKCDFLSVVVDLLRSVEQHVKE